MQSEPLDWTVPASLRALLWWPPVALVVAVLEPTAAAGTIAAAGAVRAALGVLFASVGRAIARRHGDATASVTALSAPDASAVLERQAA